MKLRIALAASCALMALPSAFAQERQLSLTIYANDLALVQDKRQVDLEGGRQRLEFADVSAQIRPENRSSPPGSEKRE